jgi:antitoxin component HigA of HigAB toxin-antitoxin module
MRFSPTAFEGLSNILYTVNKVGSFENDLRLTLDSVSAVSELLSRTKTAGLNLYA